MRSAMESLLSSLAGVGLLAIGSWPLAKSQELTANGRFYQADPLCRVTGPRMNPSVDVGCPPRPFRHLRMAQRRTPDLSSSRAPVHSALVQISVTRHHQPGRPAFISDARQIPEDWQEEEHKKMAGGLQPK